MLFPDCHRQVSIFQAILSPGHWRSLSMIKLSILKYELIQWSEINYWPEGTILLGNQENPADKLIWAWVDYPYCSSVSVLPLPPALGRLWHWKHWNITTMCSTYWSGLPGLDLSPAARTLVNEIEVIIFCKNIVQHYHSVSQRHIANY